MGMIKESLQAHFPYTTLDGVNCECGQWFDGEEPRNEWIAHVFKAMAAEAGKRARARHEGQAGS